MLDAIQLLFFEKTQQMFHPRQVRLRQVSARFDDQIGGSGRGLLLELEFSEGFSLDEQSFRIKRSWSKTNGKLNESFEVLKGGEKDGFLSNHWLENGSIPSVRFGGAFFFDGEKIESLAEENTAKVILKSAINTLFGVDLIGQLESDLQDLEKRLQREFGFPRKTTI